MKGVGRQKVSIPSLLSFLLLSISTSFFWSIHSQRAPCIYASIPPISFCWTFCHDVHVYLQYIRTYSLPNNCIII
ncbi:hypothetical protein I7I50_07218 [Histoplasma capsulatum G186AR]|uniref:Uncharacterized protein n=1 Tax=Ajellomyces capsulatus TaxID=5037 RepID=A0A8H7YWT1_AJECA|nr:hypothetical protein I7I52_09710 [Histoplasma capsulatum]QSS67972.1 hypothetical protein I7I50_07218 [Histoplasma capsulatum G186AR]